MVGVSAMSEWMCWNGVDAPLFEMEEEMVEDTTVSVTVPPLVAKFNEFDMTGDLNMPCPGCGQRWDSYGYVEYDGETDDYRRVWHTELHHGVDCSYLLWMDAEQARVDALEAF